MTNAITFDAVRGAILQVAGRPVLLDRDVASYFEVETRALNQALRRNPTRFDSYAWQLSNRDYKRLKTRGVLQTAGRGGRRTIPLVFTEHGIVMAATVLNSERAIAACRRIVEAFVAFRLNETRGAATTPDVETKPMRPVGGVMLADLKSSLLPKLRERFEALLAAEINPRTRKTVREETEAFIAEGIDHFKERLKAKGLANEEIEARVLKFIAEAEEARARAATERQMTERQRIRNQANQLRLMIRAEIAFSSGEVADLLEVLDALGSGS